MRNNQAIRQNNAGETCLVQTRDGSPVPDGELESGSVKILASVDKYGLILVNEPLPFPTIHDLYNRFLLSEDGEYCRDDT